MDKREHRIRLYEIYGGLLTEKQKKYFELYYFEDLSLGEIAENNGVSRQAVQAALSKTVDNLLRFESVLALDAGAFALEDAISSVSSLLDGSSRRDEILSILNGLRGRDV